MKLFKFFSFLLLAFALGYSQGWWKSYEIISTPQPLIILTLEQYKDHPFLHELIWEKLQKVIPYKIVIEKLSSLEVLKERLLTHPIKTHLLFLERNELLQLQTFFTEFTDFAPSLLDQLKGDFLLEPKDKFFPVLWNNKNCPNEAGNPPLKIWGFVLPQTSRRASKKSQLFLHDLIHNPTSNRILELTHHNLTFKKADSENRTISETLRENLFFNQ
jgi:hypothetical protein